jgi:hypothetical protein
MSTDKRKKNPSVFYAFMRARYIPRSHYIYWTLPFIVVIVFHELVNPPFWIQSGIWIIAWILIFDYENRFTKETMRLKGIIQ